MATDLFEALTQVDARVEKRLIEIRRELHARPELSLLERTTRTTWQTISIAFP